MIPEDSKDRITFKHIIHETLDLLSFEKGLLFTIKALIIQPAEMLFAYLFTEQRKLYSNPFKMVIIITAVSALCFSLFGFSESFLEGFKRGWDISNAESKSDAIRDSFISLVLNYPTVFALLWIPVHAILSLLFFKISKLFFAEFIVINTFILAYQNIIILFCFLLAYLVHESVLFIIPVLAVAIHFYVTITFFSDYIKIKQTVLRELGLITLSIPLYFICIMLSNVIWSKLLLLFGS